MAFRDGFADFEAAGAAIMGYSLDSAESHRAFAEKLQLPFKLLVDPDGEVAMLYGVPIVNGRTKRMTFVIDGVGKIFRSWRTVKVDGHNAEVLAAIREARAAAKKPDPG